MPQSRPVSSRIQWFLHVLFGISIAAALGGVAIGFGQDLVPQAVTGAMMIVIAVLGIVGLFCRPKVVMWAIYGMALASAVHGASIMLLPTGSLQTGVGLAIAPLMMVSMGHIWWKYHVLDSLLNREEAKS